MKVRPWLMRSTCCSSISCISTTKDAMIPPPANPNQLLLLSDSSSCSEAHASSSSASSSSPYYSTTSTTQNHSSLESNLSILTLPSLPSLQKLISPESLNLSVTTLCIASFKPAQQKPTPAHAINFLALNNNLLYAVSGSQVNVFTASNFKLFDSFHVNNNNNHNHSSIKSLAFCNGHIFTAHQDCKIRVWKLSTRDKKQQRHKLIGTLPTVEDRLRNFALPRNYVKVRRHRKKLWVEHYDAVSSLAVAENTLHSVSWDKYLKIWRRADKDLRCTESIKAHDDAINAVVVSSDGVIYTGSADKRIRVWGIRRPYGDKEKKQQHVLMATLEKHKSAVNALALTVDGSVLFSGSCDRSILVWEREDSANHMAVTGALRGHSKAILCLVNVSSCDLLLSGSADRTVRIWRRGSNDGRYCCLTVLDGHAKPVRSLVAVTEGEEEEEDSVKVFSGSFDGEIKVWKVLINSSSSVR